MWITLPLKLEDALKWRWSPLPLRITCSHKLAKQNKTIPNPRLDYVRLLASLLCEVLPFNNTSKSLSHKSGSLLTLNHKDAHKSS